MTEERISLYSDGILLAGLITLPAGKSPWPGVVLAHGFANTKSENGGFDELAQLLAANGFAVLRCDFRGCGESGAPAGRMRISREWPADLLNIISYLQGRPEVIAARIGLTGQSMGATTVTQVAAFDERVTCAVTTGCVGDGAEWIRTRWTDTLGEQAWVHFKARLQQDRLARAGSGHYETGSVPELLAFDKTQTGVYLATCNTFPLVLRECTLEAVDSVLGCAPLDVAHHLRCPVRFIHGADDDLVSSDHSIRLAEAAGRGGDLRLIEGGDHGLLTGTQRRRTQELILDWFNQYLK